MIHVSLKSPKNVLVHARTLGTGRLKEQITKTEKAMNKYIMKGLLAGTIALFTVSCGTTNKATTPDEATKGDIQQELDNDYLILSDAQRSMIDRNNAFGLRLFNKVAGMDTKVVSPLSVSYLMAMLANGADGETRQQILSTLGWSGADLAETNDLCRLLLEKEGRLDPSVTINIANYVAVSQQLSLKEAFKQAVGSHFQAGIDVLNFASPKALSTINGWCNKQTHGMIPSIINKLSPQEQAILMNAIYFNGTWSNKFDKHDTRTEPFKGYTRDIKRVQMMHQKDEFQYAEDSLLTAIQLPYGNNAYSMTVLLPRNGVSTGEVMQTLSPARLHQLDDKMEKCVVDLKLPRFSTEAEIPLNDVIAQLGAPIIFEGGLADFSLMADGGLAVSRMFQKAKIDVAEEGTKAAAVTAAMIVTTSLFQPKPREVNFYADHPFIYLIKERSSGAILFIGQYTGE